MLNLLPGNVKIIDIKDGFLVINSIFDHLGVLEGEIYSGNPNAIKLGFRLYTISYGTFEVALNKIIGNLIAFNPRLFLEELAAHRELVPDTGPDRGQLPARNSQRPGRPGTGKKTAHQGPGNGRRKTAEIAAQRMHQNPQEALSGRVRLELDYSQQKGFAGNRQPPAARKKTLSLSCQRRGDPCAVRALIVQEGADGAGHLPGIGTGDEKGQVVVHLLERRGGQQQ